MRAVRLITPPNLMFGITVFHTADVISSYRSGQRTIDSVIQPKVNEHGKARHDL